MRIVRYIWLIVTVLLLGCSRTGDGVALLTATAVGPLRMEALRSKDGQFCAVQLFRFGDFKYHAVSEWISSEGSDAAVLAEVIDR